MRRGKILNFSDVSRSLGKTSKAIKNVEITLTVIVLSIPSTSRYFPVAIPAFSTMASSRSSLFTRAQNSLTLSYAAKSTCQTSMTPVRFVVASMSFLAVSPFSVLRHPRIIFFAFNRQKCLAASRPRPTFAPVMTIVWPSNECLGYGSAVN